MWFHSVIKSRPQANDGRRTSRRPTSRFQVEALEDRSVPSATLLTDPVGDFLPTYPGAQLPGMDVVAHQVVLMEDSVVFFGRMAGPIAPTQDIGGLYLVGMDRGLGTPRFLGGTPKIGPNVTWDLVVRVDPNGTGLVNNQVAGVITPLSPTAISIDGDEFTARVPLSLLLPAATRPPEEWTYNLWPRNGVIIGQNQHVSDLAPDDGNAPVQTFVPARVASVVVNDGSAQRSMVNSLAVTFDSLVTLDPTAFTLSRQNGSPVELNVAASVVNGQTVALLTFAGSELIGGSLADGNYILTIHGDHIHDVLGQQLDGDGDGVAGGDRVDAFFRLFGDSDGDRDVDLRDLGSFLGALGSQPGDARYLAFFDVNSNDCVGAVDALAFVTRLGKRLKA